MSPQTALTDLSRAPLIELGDAPDGVPGLYLLHDHTHTPRYIGKTGNLHHRIHSNHCVGNVNSHKFVCAYNAGRLWHSTAKADRGSIDGKLAKRLRAELARRHCRVRVLPLPGIGQDELGFLETQVRRIAPAPMNDWNDNKNIPSSEPRELVDNLLDELGWGEAERAALARQEALWRAL